MADIAPSNCRPPWLETTIASAPDFTASLASSTSRIPFRISGPPQRSLIHATCSHVSFCSNCLLVHSDNDPMSSTFFTCPTILRKLCFFVPSIPSAQRGLVAILMMFLIVSLGGAPSPLRKSLCRCPSNCRSSVNTSAEHPAAFARSTRSLIYS